LIEAIKEPISPEFGHSAMVETIKFEPSCDLYLDFVHLLADDSGETSPDDIVLVSKVYPGVVHDVQSFC